MSNVNVTWRKFDDLCDKYIGQHVDLMRETYEKEIESLKAELQKSNKQNRQYKQQNEKLAKTQKTQSDTDELLILKAQVETLQEKSERDNFQIRDLTVALNVFQDRHKDNQKTIYELLEHEKSPTQEYELVNNLRARIQELEKDNSQKAQDLKILQELWTKIK